MSGVSSSIQPILIEVGSYYTRVGFAGDQDPKKVYLTGTSDVKEQFNEIFNEILKVEPANYRVVVLKNTGTAQSVLKKEADVLFNMFQVKSCAFCNAQTAILYSWAHGYNGIIFDIGYRNTICLPILDCMPQTDLVRYSPIAGKYIEEYIIKLLIDQGVDRKIIERNKKEIVEDLMKSYFYFECEDTDFEFKLIENRKKNLAKTLEINDLIEGNLKIPLPNPVLPNDILLESRFAKKKSLNDCIIDFTNTCFTEIGTKTLERIIFSGRGGQVLGFRSILNRNLLKFTNLEEAIKNYEIGIRNVPPQYKHDSWLGASILFTLKFSKNFFQTKTDHINFIDEKLEKEIKEENKMRSSKGKYG